MNPTSVVLRWLEAGGRTPTQKCEQPGCRESTRGGKPFCSEHVEQLPYVRELLSALEERDAEHARVTRDGPRAVDPSGVTAQEVLQYLRVHGSRSIKGLARELNLPVRLVDAYVRALRDTGCVRISHNRRRVPIAHLQSPCAALEHQDREAA